MKIRNTIKTPHSSDDNCPKLEDLDERVLIYRKIYGNVKMP